MERDWFFERLQLVVHDILTVQEREEKDLWKWRNNDGTGIADSVFIFQYIFLD